MKYLLLALLLNLPAYAQSYIDDNGDVVNYNSRGGSVQIIDKSGDVKIYPKAGGYSNQEEERHNDSSHSQDSILEGLIDW